MNLFDIHMPEKLYRRLYMIDRYSKMMGRK